MQIIEFPYEPFKIVDNNYTYTGDGVLGAFELMYGGVKLSPIKNLSRKDHKNVASIIKKMKAISRPRDSTNTARVLISAPKIITRLELTDEEYDILKRVIEANNFATLYSEEVDNMWFIIESAKQEVLQLVEPL